MQPYSLNYLERILVLLVMDGNLTERLQCIFKKVQEIMLHIFLVQGVKSTWPTIERVVKAYREKTNNIIFFYFSLYMWFYVAFEVYNCCCQV